MNKTLLKDLSLYLKNYELSNEIRVMEVCGTHTMEFFKTGVRSLLPENFTLIDGPGCPVCVTPASYVDRAISMAKKYNAIITTFGDMIKIPSSASSLKKEKVEGVDVRIVYSPMESIAIAGENPNRKVIFLSVGFETTAPVEAAVLIEAKKSNITNLFFLSCNKLTPPAVKALLDMGEVRIDAFILPGHVCAITGATAWNFVPTEYNKPSVIAGFKTFDLLTATIKTIQMVQERDYSLVNNYTQVVKDEGNTTAQQTMYEVFSVCDAYWRGIGIIPNSGLKINDTYKEFDANLQLPVDIIEEDPNTSCRCGELLRGLIKPVDCPLFGSACTPEEPIGPCMVSSEGPCAAFYRYGGME